MAEFGLWGGSSAQSCDHRRSDLTARDPAAANLRAFLKDAPILPSVAVIIPARNEALNLGACLESVSQALTRAGVAAEVLVVDDDSTDSTAAVALTGGAKVLRQQPRRGPLSAWMLGVASTSASVLILVDADCQVEPGAIAVLLAGLERSEVGVVAARSIPTSPGGRGGMIGRSARFSSLLLHRIKARLGDHDFVPIGRLMAVRRTAWAVEDRGLVPCDRAVAHQARTAGWEIVYAADALVFYEPVMTYRALRADYLRTRAPGGRAIPAYDRIPPGLMWRAFGSSLLTSPLDAAAWATCRVALLAQQRIRPRQAALSSWSG